VTVSGGMEKKKFIDLLRAMAANSDTQGAKAWDDYLKMVHRSR